MLIIWFRRGRDDGVVWVLQSQGVGWVAPRFEFLEQDNVGGGIVRSNGCREEVPLVAVRVICEFGSQDVLGDNA